jgi:uncharacterized membrane protein YagU involved in acid resistance
MHIVALAMMALVLGFIYTMIQPKIQAVIPASFPQGKLAQSLVVGAIILVAVFLASWIVGLFGLRKAA